MKKMEKRSKTIVSDVLLIYLKDLFVRVTRIHWCIHYLSQMRKQRILCAAVLLTVRRRKCSNNEQPK